MTEYLVNISFTIILMTSRQVVAISRFTCMMAFLLHQFSNAVFVLLLMAGSFAAGLYYLTSCLLNHNTSTYERLFGRSM